MAEEIRNSLEELVEVGESICNPKNTKTLIGATITTSTLVTTTTPSNKKREHSSTAEAETGGACVSDLTYQARNKENNVSSAGSSGGQSKRLHPQIYWSRGSSSEDSDNEAGMETSRRLNTRIVITAGGGMTGKDNGSPDSTEPSHEGVEIAPLSPEEMETTEGNTDIDATGDCDYIVIIFVLADLRVYHSEKCYLFLDIS